MKYSSTPYDLMRSLAKQKGWTTKAYVNTVLLEALEKERFTSLHFPNLSLIGYQGDAYYVRDENVKKWQQS